MPLVLFFILIFFSHIDGIGGLSVYIAGHTIEEKATLILWISIIGLARIKWLHNFLVAPVSPHTPPWMSIINNLSNDVQLPFIQLMYLAHQLKASVGISTDADRAVAVYAEQSKVSSLYDIRSTESSSSSRFTLQSRCYITAAWAHCLKNIKRSFLHRRLHSPSPIDMYIGEILIDVYSLYGDV